ncbi:MAG: chromosome segregation protein SMC [Cyclobacteriaceae bacterium]|nr:chromosome segregation protein SMC [Cyclobacteriaceae bacterium]
MTEQQQEDTLQNENENKSSKRSIIVTSILLLLITAVVVLIIQRYNLAAKNEQQEKALTQSFLQLDSLSNELDERILTISKLGGEVDTLLSIKAQLEAEKSDLMDRDKRSQQSIRSLKDKVEGYRELLLIKDEEIKQLTLINEQLLSENSELKVETQELNQSIRSISQQKDDLNKQMELVAQLTIQDMTVYAVSESGSERSDEFRNRNIKQLKIQFSISENKVAPIEGKELLIRITAPDGNVLFDVTRGSGTFMFKGRELFYTAKKEILYDRAKQQVIVFYEKGSDYAIGMHTVEVYTDDYLMGKGTFQVKS